MTNYVLYSSKSNNPIKPPPKSRIRIQKPDRTPAAPRSLPELPPSAQTLPLYSLDFEDNHFLAFPYSSTAHISLPEHSSLVLSGFELYVDGVILSVIFHVLLLPFHNIPPVLGVSIFIVM